MLHLSEDDIVILFAGRILWQKGILELIRSFITLQSRFKQITLIVAGEGPALKDLKDIYFSHEGIIFTGRLSSSEIMELLAESDILANPSRYPEGLPNIIIEAGLSECAIIATPMGGSAEVIKDGFSGIIIPSCSEAFLVSALERLIQSRNLRKDMGKNIHDAIIQNYSWEKVTSDMLELPYFNRG